MKKCWEGKSWEGNSTYLSMLDSLQDKAAILKLKSFKERTSLLGRQSKGSDVDKFCCYPQRTNKETEM